MKLLSHTTEYVPEREIMVHTFIVQMADNSKKEIKLKEMPNWPVIMPYTPVKEIESWFLNQYAWAFFFIGKTI